MNLGRSPFCFLVCVFSSKASNVSKKNALNERIVMPQRYLVFSPFFWRASWIEQKACCLAFAFWHPQADSFTLAGICLPEMGKSLGWQPHFFCVRGQPANFLLRLPNRYCLLAVLMGSSFCEAGKERGGGTGGTLVPPYKYIFGAAASFPQQCF